MVNFVKGKKTYIVSFLMVLIGLTNFIAGDQTLWQFVTTSSPDLDIVLAGLGLASLRAGVAKAVAEIKTLL